MTISFIYFTIDINDVVHGSRLKERSLTGNNNSNYSVRQSDFPLETRHRGDAYYGRKF